MCGRYFLRPDLDEILRFFDAEVDDVAEITAPRWNIAPTQDILAAFLTELGDRRVGWFRWGLVPSWWKDKRLPTWINARGETIHDKPAFRSAFKRRRCLVPASGFYEWHRTGDHKQPYAIAPDADGLFAMAGLWETWHGGEEVMRSATLVTTDASDPMAPIHDRMPVIVPREHFADWLDPRADAAALADILRPWPGALRLTEVGEGVNNARHTSGDWFDQADRA